MFDLGQIGIQEAKITNQFNYIKMSMHANQSQKCCMDFEGNDETFLILFKYASE